MKWNLLPKIRFYSSAVYYHLTKNAEVPRLSFGLMFQIFLPYYELGCRYLKSVPNRFRLQISPKGLDLERLCKLNFGSFYFQ